MTEIKIITNHETEDTDKCEDDRLRNPLPREYKEKYQHPDMFESGETLMAPESIDEVELVETLKEARLEEIEDIIYEKVKEYSVGQDEYNLEDDGDNAAHAFEAWFEPRAEHDPESVYDSIVKVLEDDEEANAAILANMAHLKHVDKNEFYSNVIQDFSIYTTSMMIPNYYGAPGSIFVEESSDHWSFDHSDIVGSDKPLEEVIEELMEIADEDDIHELVKSVNRRSDAEVDFEEGEISVSGQSDYMMSVYVDTDELSGSIARLQEELGLDGADDEEDKKKALKDPKEIEEGKILWSLPEGFYIVDLTTRSELKDEGRRLGHCVGRFTSYYDQIQSKEIMIWSMRTPTGKSRFTFQASIRPWRVEQLGSELPFPKAAITGITAIKGKANRLPGFRGDKFHEHEFTMIEDFLKSINIDPVDVGDMRDGLAIKYESEDRNENPDRNDDDEHEDYIEDEDEVEEHCPWCERA